MRSFRPTRNIPDLLSTVCLGLFAITLFMIFFETVSRDEVSWFFVTARALTDHLQINNFHFECQSTLEWDIPLAFLPGRVWVALLHPGNFVQFRIMGIAIYLAILLTLAAILRLLFPTLKPLYLFTGVTAALSLGVLPYTLVNVRPDGSIALGVLLLYLVFLLFRKSRDRQTRILLTVIFFFLCSWFFGIHPKVFLFGPAIAAMAFYMADRIPVRCALAALVVAMTLQSYTMWQNYMTCPDSIRTQISQHVWAVQFKEIFGQPDRAARRVSRNLKLAGQHYVGAHLFRPQYILTGKNNMWLPSDQFPARSARTMNILILMAVAGAFLWALRGAARGYKSPETHCSPVVLPLVLIGLGVLTLIASKVGGTAYEANLVWPLIALVVAALGLYGNGRHAPRFLFSALVAIAIASQIYAIGHLWTTMADSITASVKKPIYGIRQPVLSFSHTDALVKKAAQRCGIALDQSSKRLLIDNITYLTAKDTIQPLHATHMSYSNMRSGKVIQELKDLGSSGVLLYCGRLPPKMRMASTETDGICCISQKTIATFP